MDLSRNGVTIRIDDAAVMEMITERLSGNRVTKLDTPRIGEPWPGQGGVYAGVMRGENGTPDYHLIVPTDSSASAKETVWAENDEKVEGARSDFDGLANTQAIVSAGLTASAAHWATELTIDGHSDFYLPARRELSLCYANVPELFESAWYWSSTQRAEVAGCAWYQHFGNGTQFNGHKVYELRARAVRRLTIR